MAGEDVKERLLKKNYYENCPGCKVDEYKAVQQGFPIKELFVIWIVVLATGRTIPLAHLFLMNLFDSML